MSEYWKSTAYTKLETTNHNASLRHQGNLKRFIRDLHRSQEKGERDKERAKSEVARLNGIVSKERLGGEAVISSQTFKRPSPSVTSYSTANGSQRKQQLAQLAEMGISMPSGLKPEVAMPGEWQTVSQRIINPGENKLDTLPNVRKRVLNEIEIENEDETLNSNHNKWGYIFKSHQDDNDDLEDLDNLLSKVKNSNDNYVKKVEVKDEKDIKTDFDCSFPTEQTSKKHLNIAIKEEPCESTDLPPETTPPCLKMESEVLNKVVFKKRKAKNIRQK
ncbi:formin binding protein/U1 zinc finger family protein [Blumeria hordei DH14]|uniref:Formin binding protein/U1 zinc finger family protein n=1 Tax=Blumeria graminis f. sp. hordei (strain DH14) TaxID=546991 RepID=N1JJV9_BLUG1|nr:formin binding protein/U1 zinc finger family protein [Blumeria hordei DH14]